LLIPEHAKGLPVLRALSLCACCRHYPGAATDGPALLARSVISAFPGMAARSACASSVSRFAQRSLALRPAHSRCHRILWPAIRRLQPFRYLHSCSGCFRLEHFAGWGFHPLESAAFARRTPSRVIHQFSQKLLLMQGCAPEAVVEFGILKSGNCRPLPDTRSISSW